MIGQKLRNGRSEKKLTVKQVSKITKIDGALITKFELGSRIPTEEHIISLTKLYEIAPEEMLRERTKIQIRKILDTVENPARLLQDMLGEFRESDTAEPTMREIMAEIEMLKKNMLK